MGIKNIITICDRIENIKKAKYDFVISRAVAPLEQLLIWSQSLLYKDCPDNKSGLICFKGGDLQNEINNISTPITIFELKNKIGLPYFNEKKIIHILTTNIL